MSTDAAVSDENTADDRARELKERAAAPSCVDPAIARTHLDMSERQKMLGVAAKNADARVRAAGARA